MSGRVNHNGHKIGARNRYVNCLRVPSGQDRSRGFVASSSPLPSPASALPTAPFASGRLEIDVQSTTAETPASVFERMAVAAETDADAAVASLTMNDSTGVISDRALDENCIKNEDQMSLTINIYLYQWHKRVNSDQIVSFCHQYELSLPPIPYCHRTYRT